MAGSNLARVAPKASPPTRPTPSAHNGPARPASSRASTVTRQRTPYAAFLAVVALLLLAVNIVGARYYAADLATRVRHPWHAWLRPSGYVGQTAGILAFLIFALLLLYPLRKRWKALAFTGSIGKWLDVHVAAALTLPLLLMIHAGWRSQGIIGLGFTAMMIVWASGIVGRYVYTRIPRARSGVELTLEEVTAQRQALIQRIAETTGMDVRLVERTLEVSDTRATNPGILGTVLRFMTNDLVRWRLTRRLASRWKAIAPRTRSLNRAALRQAVRLASREISLEQQARMLDETRRLLHWWHVAHRPFAFTALIAVVIHVVVVVAVGATWFW